MTTKNNKSMSLVALQAELGALRTENASLAGEVKKLCEGLAVSEKVSLGRLAEVERLSLLLEKAKAVETKVSTKAPEPVKISGRVRDEKAVEAFLSWTGLEVDDRFAQALDIWRDSRRVFMKLDTEFYGANTPACKALVADAAVALAQKGYKRSWISATRTTVFEKV